MFGFSIMFIIITIIMFIVGLTIFIYIFIKASKSNSQIFENIINAQNNVDKQNSGDNIVDVTCNKLQEEEFEFCEYCGCKMSKSARRCPSCGARK